VAGVEHANSLGLPVIVTDHHPPVAALSGATLMLVADWLGRYLIFPYELGAGKFGFLSGPTPPAGAARHSLLESFQAQSLLPKKRRRKKFPNSLTGSL